MKAVFALSETVTGTRHIYCQLLGHLLLKKLIVTIDYGQPMTWGGVSTTFIKDETGKDRKFNSMIDAMNFMGERGWVFVQAFVVEEVGLTGSSSVYHWVLRKEIPV